MSDDKDKVLENDVVDDVIIVEESFWQPFLKALKYFVVGVVGVSIMLFLAGLIMGFAGIRPPTIDPNAITNSFESSVPVESSEPSSQPMETNSTGESKGSESSGEKIVIDTDNAFDAGVAAGEAYKDHMDNVEDFWKGFNKGSGEKK